jgi:toxin FitB
MTFLLDTNVISEFRKLRPDPQVMTWFDAVSSAEIFISALTIGEIRIGIERLRRKYPLRRRHSRIGLPNCGRPIRIGS